MPEPGNPNIKRINNIQLPGLNHSGSTERINYSNRPAQKYQSNNQHPQYEPTVPKKSKLANSKIITQAPKKSGTLNQVGLSQENTKPSHNPSAAAISNSLESLNKIENLNKAAEKGYDADKDLSNKNSGLAISPIAPVWLN